jgi:hypothetical protein
MGREEVDRVGDPLSDAVLEVKPIHLARLPGVYYAAKRSKRRAARTSSSVAPTS